MTQDLITKVIASSGICTPEHVEINDKAATRSAIISFIRKNQINFIESSQWGALSSKGVRGDWNFKSIALHHAGNISCEAANITQLRKIEEIDSKNFDQMTYHYAVSCSGEIYELLDIRYKGSHISNGNTKVIGVVMLADLSHAGEAYEQEYKNKSRLETAKSGLEIINDNFDNTYNTVSRDQENALITLVAALKKYFALETLGGHREFQVLANKEGRACPGAEGMKIVSNLRSQFSIVAPSSSNYPHK